MEGGGVAAGRRLAENAGAAGAAGRIAATANRSERRFSGSTVCVRMALAAGRGVSVVDTTDGLGGKTGATDATDGLGDKSSAAGATERIASNPIRSERGSPDSTL
jgi:hypothetical protein